MFPHCWALDTRWAFGVLLGSDLSAVQPRPIRSPWSPLTRCFFILTSLVATTDTPHSLNRRLAAILAAPTPLARRASKTEILLDTGLTGAQLSPISAERAAVVSSLPFIWLFTGHWWSLISGVKFFSGRYGGTYSDGKGKVAGTS